MLSFKLPTELKMFASIAEFVEAMQFNEKDVIVTNEPIYAPSLQSYQLKAKLLRHEFVGLLRSQLFEQLCRNGIERTRHTFLDRHCTAGRIFAVVHRPRIAFRILYERTVVNRGVRRSNTGIHRRTIGRQRLDRGTRLTACVRRVRESAAAGLFTAAAAQCLDLACVLV